MKRLALIAIVLILVRLAVVSAHHPLSNYNLDGIRTLEGTLVELRFMNPHSLLTLEVPDRTSHPQQWTVEWAPVLLLRKQGVTSAVLAIGDRLVVTGFVALNPADHR